MAWSLGTGLLRSTSNTNKTDSLLFRGGGCRERERDQSNNSDSIYMTPSEVNECDTGHGHLHGRVGSFVWGGDRPTSRLANTAPINRHFRIIIIITIHGASWATRVSTMNWMNSGQRSIVGGESNLSIATQNWNKFSFLLLFKNYFPFCAAKFNLIRRKCRCSVSHQPTIQYGHSCAMAYNGETKGISTETE